MESRESDYEPLEATAQAEVDRDSRMLRGSYDDALAPAEVPEPPADTQDQQALEQAREDRVVDSLETISGLRPEVWTDASPDVRLGTLRQAEAAMCAIDDRLPPAIEPYAASPGDYGAYRPDAHEIGIGDWSLENHGVEEVVNSLAHEDRHAYQNWAIEHPGFHPDPAEVEAWRQNAEDYVTFPEDPVLYREQPMEADAWDYGDRIAARLYGGRA